jgi:hypothetical protein
LPLQIIDFAGRVPGDVGVAPSWGRNNIRVTLTADALGALANFLDAYQGNRLF